MRRANRRCKQQIFTDGEVFVEGVLLGHITDVVLQDVEILIERLAVEDDISAGWLELTGEHSHQRALSRTARAHHANKLATRDAKRDSLKTNLAFAKTVRDFVYLESANDVAFFLDDSFRKVAPQNLSDIDSNRIAVPKLRRRAHSLVAHHDRPVRFNDLQNAHALVVVAENLQHDITARTRRQQNIVSLKPARVVRHQIFRFGGLELKSAAQGASTPAQIAQIHFAVVVENDPVLERGLDLCAGFQSDSVEFGIHIPQRLHSYVQSEGDPQRAFTRSRAFQFHFIRFLVHTDENLWKRNVLLGVEILCQLLVAEHLVAYQNALARINSAEAAAHQWSPAHRDVLAAVIFQQNQIVIAKRHQVIGFAEILENYICLAIWSERQRFQGGGAMLIDRGVRVL